MDKDLEGLTQQGGAVGCKAMVYPAEFPGQVGGVLAALKARHGRVRRLNLK